jgi:hypothetical protein
VTIRSTTRLDMLLQLIVISALTHSLLVELDRYCLTLACHCICMSSTLTSTFRNIFNPVNPYADRWAKRFSCNNTPSSAHPMRRRARSRRVTAFAGLSRYEFFATAMAACFQLMRSSQADCVPSGDG